VASRLVGVEVNVSDYEDAGVFIELLREACGFVWHFRLGVGGPRLAVGVRGGLGALVWSEGDAVFVPAGGLNSRPVGYRTWLGHEALMPPRSELPIEEVYTVLDELIRTQRRPTCVRWEPA
jgi:hypothetical protein